MTTPFAIAMFTAAALGTVVPAALGQELAAARFALTTADGAFRRGEPVELDRERGALVWRDAGAPGTVAVPLDQLVMLHGQAAREAPGGVVVRLVGGDELRGELAGGDAGGETLVVRSPVLGPSAIRVDRVRAVAMLERLAGARIDDLEVPPDAEEEEALYLPARRGLDVIVGLAHRFRDDGVLFEARGDDGPVLRDYARLAGYALRGGESRQDLASSTLLTVAGDRLGVDWVGLDDAAFTFRLEDGRDLRLSRSQVASLAPRAARWTFLSDLPVVEARENSYFGDDGGEPLLPYRIDRAVVGGPLSASGLGFGHGIGVHSRSLLAWQVPENARTLIGLVAIDDSALDLPVRGAVVVRVRLDDAVVFEADVRIGQPPCPLGAIPVRPGATLQLEVDFGPGLDLGDRVDWLDIAFVR